MQDYIPPAHQKSAFHCPWCGSYSHQVWYGVSRGQGGPYTRVTDLDLAMCHRCNRYSLWLEQKLLYPPGLQAPLPNPDMPTDVAADYLEARSLVQASPRAAAALLRLAVQRLMSHLGESGKNINADIASLVKKGLLPLVQQSLDAVRVIGNNAVHPGQISFEDTPETAQTLFRLVNIIVEQMITVPKSVEGIYAQLPEGARAAIEKRDGGQP